MTPENTDIEGVVESGEVELDVEDVVDAVVHCPVQLVAVLGQTLTNYQNHHFLVKELFLGKDEA